MTPEFRSHNLLKKIIRITYKWQKEEEISTHNRVKLTAAKKDSPKQWPLYNNPVILRLIFNTFCMLHQILRNIAIKEFSEAL